MEGTWKENIDMIRVICNECDKEMDLESMLNNHNGIFGCGCCGEHVKVEIKK